MHPPAIQIGSEGLQMTKTHQFALGALGACLVAYGVGCGGGGRSSTGAAGSGSVTTGAAGTFGQGQAGDNGLAGTFGQGQAGDNGQAGAGGGQAGTRGGGNTD